MQTNSPQTDVAFCSVPSKVLNNNQFGVSEVPSGSALLVGDTAVFDVAGNLCAAHAKCPHKQGPLNEGTLDGSTVTCPWYGSQFDVCTGAVLQAPAVEPLKTYRVAIEGKVGLVETL